MLSPTSCNITVPSFVTYVTVVPVNPGVALDATLERIQSDDVHHPEFLKAIIFTGASEQEIALSPETRDCMTRLGVKWHKFVPDAKQGDCSKLVPGPQLFKAGKFFQVLKIYEDTNEAFLLGLRPRFGNYRTKDLSYQSLRIATPSRVLTLQASPQKPLMGVRVAVKDCFRIKRLKTSLCNSAYLDISGLAEATAPLVDVLVQAGAQILGMTKLSALIAKEEPSEAMDFSTAFNPRGDGFQSPAGSSSGSAVAVAAYDWVDIAVGTDTSGSGRRPALVNGVFQFRPSHDTVCLDDIVPIFPPWDTPCLFSRDITGFRDVLSVWYSTIAPSHISSLASRTAKPAVILYPTDYFPVQNLDQMKIIQSFALDLEKFLNVRVSEVSISAMWSEKPPEEAGDQSVQQFLKETAVHTLFHDSYHSMSGFRTRYFDKHFKEPKITPFSRWRWQIGKQVTSAQYEEGIRRLAIYKEWFLKTVMRSAEFQSLLLLPIDSVQPNYRDSPPPEPVIQEGFDQILLPSILGASDIVVPLGESAYLSRVTGREEWLPVAVDIVGLPGSDLVLLETVRACLAASNRSLKVATGARLFGSPAR